MTIIGVHKVSQLYRALHARASHATFTVAVSEVPRYVQPISFIVSALHTFV